MYASKSYWTTSHDPKLVTLEGFTQRPLGFGELLLKDTLRQKIVLVFEKLLFKFTKYLVLVPRNIFKETPEGSSSLVTDKKYENKLETRYV